MNYCPIMLELAYAFNALPTPHSTWAGNKFKVRFNCALDAYLTHDCEVCSHWEEWIASCTSL